MSITKPKPKFNRKTKIIMSVVLCVFSFIGLYEAIHDYQHYWDIPLTVQDIKELKNTDNHTLVIYPFFTQYAYMKHGFYEYFNKTCDTSCLTISYDPFNIKPSYVTGKSAYNRLLLLNYPAMSDLYLSEHPEILNNYNKVIVLHEEYVTQNLFNILSTKNNTVFLYPNALYALIDVNYKNKTFTLIKGHGYPDIHLRNGFGWQYSDSTKNEYDLKCDSWKFEKLPHHSMMLNCFPEMLILHNTDLLKEIRDYK